MRYQESRERSAELMRLAVREMYRNPAALHPHSYALWYEYFAGINSDLSAALEPKLAAGETITDPQVEALHRTHVAAREARSSERMQHELARLIEQVGEMASGAGEGMAEYSGALAECAVRLRIELNPEALNSIVSMLTERTEVVRGSTARLSDDLGRFRAEAEALRSQVDKLREEALTDALTGLSNRRGLERSLEQNGLGATGLGGASLLVCDVDHFKKLNDSYGHLVGDRVLAGIGRLMKARVKGRDVVARWGGEEFVVVLPETAARNAHTVAEQIREDIARGKIKRIDRDEFIGTVTISIGVAEGVPGESLAALIARADAALYQAKSGGRNRTVLAAASSPDPASAASAGG